MPTLDELYGIGLTEAAPSAPTPKAGGNFWRGATESVQQLPQLGYGILAGTGAALESTFGAGGIGTGIKTAGVKGFTEWGNKIAAGAKETDEWDYSWQRAKEGDLGALSDWLAHGLGYVGGQAVQTLATGLIGGAVGKATLGTLAKTMAEGMVAKEAKAIGATEAAKKLTGAEITELATRAVASKIGQTTAMGATSVGMEGGEIFGDLTQEATKEGRTLTGAELGKAFAATLAAGGLEFVGDKLGLDVMLGKSRLLRPTQTIANAPGKTGRLLRGGTGALGTAAVEGATEYGQTLIEEAGKGHDAFSEESLRQAKNAAAIGVLGGTAMGGISGAFRGPQQEKAEGRPSAPPSVKDVLAETSVDDAAKTAMRAVSEPIPAGEVIEHDLLPDFLPIEDVTYAPPPDKILTGYAKELTPEVINADAALMRFRTPEQIAAEGMPPIPAGEATWLIPTGDALELENVPIADVQSGDLLAKDGEPFVSRTGAQARAYVSGGKVVAIPNHFGDGQPGYVVRPLVEARPNNTRGTNAGDIARAGGQRPDDAGRGAGTAKLPDQRPTDVLASAASPAGQGVAGPGAAGGGGAKSTALTALTVSFGGKTYPVASVEDAQRKWEQFRDSADGGAAAGVSQIGNGVEVRDGLGNFVARISYNGRVWDTPDSGPVKTAAEAPQIAAGQRVSIDGKGYTVVSANQSAVKLDDGQGGTRMIAAGSKAYGRIQQEPNEAARPQAQAAGSEAAAPAAVPAAAPVVVPGAGAGAVEAAVVRDKALAAFKAAASAKHGGDHQRAAEMMADRLLPAIEAKSADALLAMNIGSADMNPGSRAMFEAVTGVKLPKGRGDSERAIDRWAGVSEQQRAEKDASRKAKIQAKSAARELEIDRKAAAGVQVKDGERTVDGAAWVDELMAKGFTKVVQRGPKTYLANAEGDAWPMMHKDIAKYARSKASTPAPAAPNAAPAATEAAPAPQATEAERYAAGRSLTKEQRKQVLDSLVDVYKAKGADREMKGVGRDGNERYGYVHSPELFEKSDITGAMVRYYVTLPDGRRAHPTELFPDYTQSDVDAALAKREADEKADRENQAGAEARADKFAAPTVADAEASWKTRNKGLPGADPLRDWRTGQQYTLVTLEKNGTFYSARNDDAALIGRLERAGWKQTDATQAPASEQQATPALSQKAQAVKEALAAKNGKQTAAMQSEAAPPTQQQERRKDLALRKRVSEMTDAEKTAALLKDDLTGLNNGRWMRENEASFSHVVAFDADSLKWVNDNMGHESGDMLLKAWGEALQRATGNAARVGGDEFFALANSQQEAQEIASAVEATLAKAVISASTPTGDVTITGIGASFGIATNKKAADEALNQHKRAREATGARAGRGEQPPGTVRTPASGQQTQVDQDGRPADTAEPAIQAAAILDAAAEPPKGKERLDVLKDVKAGAVTPDEVAAAYPAKDGAKPAKIGDFGEKLKGARKDYAATLKDAESVDVAAEPLAKSWPEPDYQKLLDSGADPYMVAFIRAARDELPTKPQKAWKLRGWVEQATMLRDMAGKLLSGSISKARHQEMMSEPRFETLKRVIGSRAELYELVGHGQSLKGVTYAQHTYGLYKGQRNVTKWVVEQRAKASTFGNWPTELAVGDTKQEMLDRFVERMRTQEATGDAAKAPNKGQFAIYRKRGQPGAFIGKKIGREYIDLHKADDVAAARKYLDEKTADLEAALAKYKETPFERKSENQPRVGDDHRNGAPVTPEAFQDAFGFRGVQFGNYVEQGRRQSDLNQAYDGLMDLAAVLGIPPRALSLNGRLGLAFGARGKGGKNAPAAHYETGNVVINLTKGSGPGSLAHEWWHSLDNYFGKEFGEGGYLTGGAAAAQLRPEMKSAFQAVKTATQNPTLRKRAEELDKRRSKPYWDTPIELSARAFESYVIAKLQDQGAANDYLANVVDEEVWNISERARAELFGGSQFVESYPYPLQAEMPQVRAAFDDFFRVVETRTDDAGNVALFSRAQAASTGVSMQDAKAAVAAIREALPYAPDIVLHDNLRDAPEGLQELIRSNGAANDVEAAYHDGKIHVFPGNIPSIERLQFVVAHHEVRHHGLRSILGAKMAPAMLRMYASNRALKAAADAKMHDGLASTKAIAVEEALADMPVEALQKLNGWQRIVAAARQWLRKMADKLRSANLDTLADALEPARWTDADIAALVQRAEDVSRRGPQPTNTMAGTVFQRVFHGSPHRGIDKFSTDKIGTGEGAAAFGHGLYFTDRREIAEWYREKLSGSADQAPRRFFKGQEFQPGTGGYFAARIVESSTVAKARKDVAGWVKDAETWSDKRKADKGEQETLHVWQEALDILNRAEKKSDFTKKAAQGQLYEVDIPEDSELLLWDKQLSEQPEKVRAAIKGIMTSDVWDAPTRKLIGDADIKGKKFYEALASTDAMSGRGEFGKAASEALLAAGVKGIKYLDGTSRGAGDGSYNYVIFSGDDTQIAGTAFSRSAAGNVPLVTLHRAAADTYVARGYSFTEDNRTAAAYTNNPGFGGKNIFTIEVPRGNVLDLTKGDPWERLASASGVTISRDSYDGYIARVLPTDDKVLDALAEKGYDWVRLADDYPQGAITWQVVSERAEWAATDAIEGLEPDTQAFAQSTQPKPSETRFSRRTVGTGAGQTRQSTMQSLRDTVADHLSTEGAKVSVLDKTFKTQLAKALKFPAFKVVYDQLQQSIEDTSSMGNEAQTKAPSILSKLEKWTDLGQPALSEKDSRAIAAPLFTGTLTDKTIYSDAELQSRFNLTPTQIGLYREALAAINTSLDQVVAAEVLQLIGDPNPALQELALTDRMAFRAGVGDYLRAQIASASGNPDELAKLQDLQDKVDAKYKRISDLKSEGYVPLMRFGKYLVNVEDPATGKSVFFGRYESLAEANAAFREISAKPKYKGMEVTQDVLSEEEYKLFSDIPIESMEMFADAIGASQSEVFQKYLRMAKSDRSALKRLIERKGTPGYSEDIQRVLAAFVMSNARLASGVMNWSKAESAAHNIKNGDIRDEAIKLIEAVQTPSARAGWVRGLMFFNFIQGSIASALVNLTQPVTMTLPHLSQWGGIGKATARLAAAGKMTLTGQFSDPILKAALARAEADGTVSPQEIHYLSAQATGSLGNSRALKKIAQMLGVQPGRAELWMKKGLFVWGAPFSLAEQFNRRVTFIAAYKTAQEEGIGDPFAFAENAVQVTQGVYNIGNAPNVARGAVGAALMTFKQFSINYLEWLSRMWRAGPEGKRAAGYAMALLIMAAGTDGLPGADDLDDLIDTFAQAFGYDFTSKRVRREFVAKYLGETFADVSARGFSAIAGIPMDVSMRMSLGNLIPGTGLMLRSTTDKSNDLLELAGPLGGLAKQYMTAGQALLRGDIGTAAMNAPPIAVQNLLKGLSMLSTGEARDASGKKIMDVDAVDAAVKIIGFNPSSIARESQKIGMIRRSEQLAKNVEGEIAAKWARAIADKDPDGIAEAREQLAEWNENNPDARIRITMNQLVQRVKKLRETRAARFITSVSPERRGAVSEAMQ